MRYMIIKVPYFGTILESKETRMEHSLYLDGMKRALKARGVNYAELATRLKMTESGVKKMLNAKDISFRRVLQICSLLDILPGQLFSLSESAGIREVALTAKQEDALIKDRTLLAVYWRFVVERRSSGEIESLERLTTATLKKSLQRLAALGLVSESRGQFKAPPLGKFRWSDDSKLAQLLNAEWSQLTLKRALKRDEGAFHRLVTLKATRETYDGLIRGISEALDEAVRASERDEVSAAPERLLGFTALAATVPKGVLDSD